MPNTCECFFSAQYLTQSHIDNTTRKQMSSTTTTASNNNEMQEVFVQTTNLCIGYMIAIQIVVATLYPRHVDACMIVVTLLANMLCEHIILIQRHILHNNHTTAANLLRHTHVVMKALMMLWVAVVIMKIAGRSMPMYRVAQRLDSGMRRREHFDRSYRFDFVDGI